MKTLFRLVLVIGVLVAYLLFWPVPIEPIAWTPSVDPGYVGLYQANDKMAAAEYIDLPAGEYGPEDIAVGSDGLLYTAVHSGKILRIDPATSRTETFADTGGRPLGIEFDGNGTLWVADAFRGLLMVSGEGDVELITAETDDCPPILYADDLDIAPDGRVYFSDASTRFGAKQGGDTLSASLLDLTEHIPNGRVLVYDPATGSTTLFADGLSFANGVALTADGDALLVNETGTYSVHRYSLIPASYGERVTLIDNLPGFPDNVNRMPDGSFWVGIVSPRAKALDDFADKPKLREIIMRLPASARPGPQRYGFVLRITADGEVLDNVQGPDGQYASTTGAPDLDGGKIAISSLTEPRIALLNL